MITSLCSFIRDSVTMVAVGMATGCVSMFTLDGRYFGMFSQV